MKVEATSTNNTGAGADYLLTAATATGRGQSENRNINGFILRDGNGNCSLDSRRVQNITGSWCLVASWPGWAGCTCETAAPCNLTND